RLGGMRLVAILLVAGAVTGAAMPLPGAAAGGAYLTSQFRWQAEGGFEVWETGPGATRAAGGRLALDPASAQAATDTAGAYHGRSFYNGGPYVFGEATGPLTPAGFGITRAVPSWDADPPPGS